MLNAFKLDNADEMVIDEVLNIVHKKYMNNIGVEYIADNIYLTPNYLSHLFKKKTGVSLTRYIISYRMKKAEELLRTTDMKISCIAENTGYKNHSYFSMIFKRAFGMSPGRYREKTA
jgi:two-component system response regulator YesN